MNTTTRGPCPAENDTASISLYFDWNSLPAQQGNRPSYVHPLIKRHTISSGRVPTEVDVAFFQIPDSLLSDKVESALALMESDYEILVRANARKADSHYRKEFSDLLRCGSIKLKREKYDPSSIPSMTYENGVVERRGAEELLNFEGDELIEYGCMHEAFMEYVDFSNKRGIAINAIVLDMNLTGDFENIQKMRENLTNNGSFKTRRVVINRTLNGYNTLVNYGKFEHTP